MGAIHEHEMGNLADRIETGDKAVLQQLAIMQSTVTRHEERLVEQGKELRAVTEEVSGLADDVEDEDRGLAAHEKKIRRLDDLVTGVRAIWWVACSAPVISGVVALVVAKH